MRSLAVAVLLAAALAQSATAEVGFARNGKKQKRVGIGTVKSKKARRKTTKPKRLRIRSKRKG